MVYNKTIHCYLSQIFPQVPIRKFVVSVGKVVTWPLPNSILDLLTTTNLNLVNNIETHTGISDHQLVAFNICMKTKPPRKLFDFQKAGTNNPKSNFFNFSQWFPYSSPITNSMDTNWEIMQHDLHTVMDTTVP